MLKNLLKPAGWWRLAAVCLLLASSASAQEHSYAPADIQAGQGLYQANCLGCHGNDGNAVNGTEMGQGRFRHGSSDEDLIRVIRQGLPGTPMPSHTHLSTGQARTVVAFLRSLTSGGQLEQDDREVRIGDVVRGKDLFYGEAECDVCHGVNGGGLRLYPDLGSIGTERSPASLEESILDANAEIRPHNRFYRVMLKDGREIRGRLLNQDTHSVQLMDEDERLLSLLKSDMEAHGFTSSPMASYRDVLSDEEVADLLAFLLSLGGAQ